MPAAPGEYRVWEPLPCASADDDTAAISSTVAAAAASGLIIPTSLDCDLDDRLTHVSPVATPLLPSAIPIGLGGLDDSEIEVVTCQVEHASTVAIRRARKRERERGDVA